MKNKTRWLALLTAVLLISLPAAAYDDEEYEPPEDKSEGHVDLGWQDSDTDEAVFRAAEYEDIDSNPVIRLRWANSPYEDNKYRADLNWVSEDHFRAAFKFDLQRSVRVTVHGVANPHNLDHDPLSNLKAVSDVKVVRSTDLEPGADYQIRHENAFIRGDFLVPSVEGLSFRAEWRNQMREGTKQSLHTGHCTACHTTSRGREVDQQTNEGVFGVNFSKGRVDLGYQVMSRDFVENGAQPVATFETPFRPAPPPWAPDQTVLPGEGLFVDRLWFPVPGAGPFDSQTASYDRVPDVERIAHAFKIKAQLRDKDSVNFTVLQSTTKNEMTDLEYDFQGFRGRYTWVPKSSLRVNLFAQHDKLENDDYFVDLAALWGGGPYPSSYGAFGSVTFEEWRLALEAAGLPDVLADPMNFSDFTRLSSLDRTDKRYGVDLFWRPVRRGTFRASLTHRAIDRDHVVLIDGTGETTSDTLKLGWNQRTKKKLRWNNTLEYRTIDNPYASEGGARRAFLGFRGLDGEVFGFADTDRVNPPGPSPKNPYSLQYYQLQALRVANISSFPTDYLRYRTNVNWSPKGKWSLGANFRYKTAENDELNYSVWEQDTMGIGANLWVAAHPEVHFTFGIDHFTEETDAYATVPLMDG
jgi:hypothetical protein